MAPEPKTARAKRQKSGRLTPSSKDSSVGAKLALRNARRHLRGAEALADEGLFGYASTHVVLSIEELIKAWMLMLHTMGFTFPGKYFAAVLSEHGARHAITIGMVFVFMIRSLAVRTARRVQRRHNVKGYPPRIRGEWVAELTKEFHSLTSRSPRSEPLLAVLEWLGKANEIKNRGLYVDFDGTKWMHPGQTSKARFMLGFEVAHSLIRQLGREINKSLRNRLQVNEQINSFLNEQLKKMEERTLEENLTDLIAMALGQSPRGLKATTEK